jgi:tRNA (cmo5U34)-methyltransferase
VNGARVGRLFGESAAGYDAPRRRLVPGFDEFYGAVLESIPFERRDAHFRVLDLGAGTGLLSGMVGEAFPGAEVTLVDLSEGMLGVARERLSGEPEGRFEFRVADYSEETLPGEYEVVVSALSIHHVGDEAKRRVFREAHRVLACGGVFVNADQVLGETPGRERENHEAWLREARRLGASEAEIASALRRMETDRCATLASQLAWMREAGFERVRTGYENDRFAVYSGRKGSGRKDVA